MSDLHLDAALLAVDRAGSICRDGKADVKCILRTLVNGPGREENTYHIGQRVCVAGEKYILAHTGSYLVTAVCLENGGYWHSGVRVGSVNRITQAG